MHASTASTGDGLRAGQLVLLRVLDLNRVISTGKGAGVGRLILVLVGSPVTIVGRVNSSNSSMVDGGRRNGGEEGGLGGGNDGATWAKRSESSSGSTVGKHVACFVMEGLLILWCSEKV